MLVIHPRLTVCPELDIGMTYGRRNDAGVLAGLDVLSAARRHEPLPVRVLRVLDRLGVLGHLLVTRHEPAAVVPRDPLDHALAEVTGLEEDALVAASDLLGSRAQPDVTTGRAVDVLGITLVHLRRLLLQDVDERDKVVGLVRGQTLAGVLGHLVEQRGGRPTEAALHDLVGGLLALVVSSRWWRCCRSASCRLRSLGLGGGCHTTSSPSVSRLLLR
jgi:hypothetical protein